MKLSDLTVEVRDINLNRLGQIVPADLDLLLEDQFNNVGSWTLTVATDHPLASALRTPGAGIIITGADGLTLLSGPTIKPESAATSTDPGGTLTVDGLTDTVILADRLAFPDPTNVDPTTQTLAHDSRTGAIETLMHAYVNANIGPSAPSARRDTRLTMGTNLGRGATVTKNARFPVLGNLLVELAITAGLGFRVVQVGSVLQFQTFAVTDRTSEIRLDIRNNTLAGHRHAIAPPGVTRVIVAGQGEQVDRTFVEVDTADSLAGEALWGRRIEQFIDQRQTNDTTELTQAGLEALADNGFSQTSIQVVPMEDSTMEFGDDWALGDRVAVIVEGAEVYSDVTGYVMRANKDGLKMGAILGDPSVIKGTTASDKLTQMDARVSNLERNAEQGAPSAPDPTIVHNPYTGNMVFNGNTTNNGNLTVVGNYTVEDAATPTKAYRFRTSGSALDFEAGAADMYLSVWDGAGFTGTQHTKMIAQRTSTVKFPDGASSSLAPSNTDHLTRKDYVDKRHQAIVWNGSAYVPVTNAGIFVGPVDPGSQPDGTVWLDTS